MVKANGDVEWLESGEAGYDVVEFCFDLGGAFNEMSCGEKALEDLGYAIPDTVACSCLVVCGTPQAVVTIVIDVFAPFARLVLVGLEEFESKFAFEADGENLANPNPNS